MKAWAAHESFTEGTNLRAWLFYHHAQRLLQPVSQTAPRGADTDGEAAARLAVQPAQHGHLDLADFNTALERLPDDQREALILVGASGFSCEEAAEICGCAVGTIKSRSTAPARSSPRCSNWTAPGSPDAVTRATAAVRARPSRCGWRGR